MAAEIRMPATALDAAAGAVDAGAVGEGTAVGCAGGSGGEAAAAIRARLDLEETLLCEEL